MVWSDGSKYRRYMSLFCFGQVKVNSALILFYSNRDGDEVAI